MVSATGTPSLAASQGSGPSGQQLVNLIDETDDQHVSDAKLAEHVSDAKLNEKGPSGHDPAGEQAGLEHSKPNIDTRRALEGDPAVCMTAQPLSQG